MLVYGMIEERFDKGLVLDIGSKDGKIIELVSGRFDIISVDLVFSDEKAERDYMTYIKSDGRRLAFKDGSFDIVVANQVLEHVYDKKSLIKEAYRVLKPGGVFLLSFPNRCFPYDWHGFPIGTPWIPKPFGNVVFKLLGKEEYDKYKNHLHYISSIGAYNILKQTFDEVDFVSIDAIVECGDKILGDTWKGDLVLQYRDLLRRASKNKLLLKLIELTFPHTIYWCQKRAI